METPTHTRRDAEGRVDIDGDAFARRFGNLMVDARERAGESVRDLAKRSDGMFRARELKAIESGRLRLDGFTVDNVAELYGLDVDAILPARLELEIGDDGVLTTAGISTRFTPGDADSLLRSYLRLVRKLRRQQAAPEIDLRREDIDDLADHLGVTGDEVVDRLAGLMGVTRAQRRMMAGLFMAGALVITVAVPVGAAVTGGGADEVVPVDAGASGTVTTVEADVPATDGGAAVDGGVEGGEGAELPEYPGAEVGEAQATYPGVELAPAQTIYAEGWDEARIEAEMQAEADAELGGG